MRILAGGDTFKLRLNREEFEALQFAASLAVSSVLLPTHPKRELLENLTQQMDTAIGAKWRQ